ncbi:MULTISPECIES: hypothetical protein [Bradyrhizobium]|uniref:Isochorismatase-like domain-containing protein n=1 Tax=Bradyrhizobium elkanii TaxID=29448 RepID=A0A4U6S2S6_BRAEL|nr:MULTISPECIES: hypothetical protein [Bradyrhizobium]MTV14029.1 hypothetical protein [Bradyrhizobium sp. BR2003]TKV80342.1 hypothetical protein FDV58_16320 [Bradyrhizobium elkanii]
MLADPRHSCVILLNLSRKSGVGVSAPVLRDGRNVALLAACQEVFGIPLIAVGEYDRSALSDRISACIEHLDTDALSLWQHPRIAARLATSDPGVIFLGGAFLEEEVLIAALEGARHGYDIRLLADLSVGRYEADRALVLTRLGHYGILATTIRQTLFEWAVSLGDQAKSERVQDLLS